MQLMCWTSSAAELLYAWSSEKSNAEAGYVMTTANRLWARPYYLLVRRMQDETRFNASTRTQRVLYDNVEVMGVSHRSRRQEENAMGRSGRRLRLSGDRGEGKSYRQDLGGNRRGGVMS